MHNLANNPEYAYKLKELKEVLFNWINEVGDLSAIPEQDMVVTNWWKGESEPPKTALPEIMKVENGIKISCETEGASLGYRIVASTEPKIKTSHTINSWDFGYIGDNENKEGALEVPVPWNVYNGEVIELKDGEIMMVNAHRIGYQPSEIIYIPE